MAHFAIEEMSSGVMSRHEDKRTTIIEFDTDKTDSIGLPTVKTIIRQETKREEGERQTTSKKEDKESERKSGITDKSVEGSIVSKEIEERGGFSLLDRVIRTVEIVLLLMAIWSIYKLIKILK